MLPSMLVLVTTSMQRLQDIDWFLPEILTIKEYNLIWGEHSCLSHLYQDSPLHLAFLKSCCTIDYLIYYQFQKNLMAQFHNKPRKLSWIIFDLYWSFMPKKGFSEKNWWVQLRNPSFPFLYIHFNAKCWYVDSSQI